VDFLVLSRSLEFELDPYYRGFAYEGTGRSSVSRDITSGCAATGQARHYGSCTNSIEQVIVENTGKLSGSATQYSSQACRETAACDIYNTNDFVSIDRADTFSCCPFAKERRLSRCTATTAERWGNIVRYPGTMKWMMRKVDLRYLVLLFHASLVVVG